MQNHSALFRDYLDRCDIEGVRKLWKHVAPHLPQPHGDFEVQVMIHSARTQAEFLPLKLRAYSHQWMLANGLPSQLPEHLKPAAERYDFRFAYGVGIAMKTTSSGTDPQRALKKQLAREIQTAMGQAVEEAFADGRTDSDHLRRRMGDAKDRALRNFGRPKINVTARLNFSGLPARLPR